MDIHTAIQLWFVINAIIPVFCAASNANDIAIAIAASA